MYSHLRLSFNIFSVLIRPGLPDGFFSNQRSQFGSILEGPRFDIFYCYLEYFTDIWDISITIWFNLFVDIHLVRFFRFWYHVPRKVWQPWIRLFYSFFKPKACATFLSLPSIASLSESIYLCAPKQTDIQGFLLLSF
jgi:hypothetical protein